MNGRLAIALVLVLLSIAASAAVGPTAAARRPGPAASGASSAPRQVPGEVIVRFRRGTSAGERRDTREDADVRFSESLSVPRAQLLEVRRGQTTARAVDDLERDPDVLYAEPNLVIRS